jgi:hypothetical protein
MTPKERAELLFNTLAGADAWADPGSVCGRDGILRELTATIRAAVAEEWHEARGEMPCGHPLACWRPNEGTTSGAIYFSQDPVQFGHCTACAREGAAAIRAAVAAEREAILRTLCLLRDEHSPTHDWARGIEDCIAAIRARAQPR